jgi:hypothetical protein
MVDRVGFIANAGKIFVYRQWMLANEEAFPRLYSKETTWNESRRSSTLMIGL